MYLRNRTKKIKIGKAVIGGGSPVLVQSMTKTDTSDVRATINQIRRLEKAGCEIIRVAVPDMDAAKKLSHIKKNIKIPLVADIHYDYKLALEAINQCVDKIRINPGNMPKERAREVIKAAKDTKIPIRIGVNVGSLRSAHDLEMNPDKKASMLVEAAVEHIKMMEDMDFTDIVVSLKASDVVTTIKSYEKFAEKYNYPLHLGITESGPPGIGTIKSAVGLGILLYKGLGDTIRVSLTSSPEKEVVEGYRILQALGLRNYGFDIISCPTCGRCEVDLIKMVQKLEKQLSAVCHPQSARSLKVAVMGCIVNGPGEAKDADVGIAGGKDIGLLFKKGKAVRKIKPSEWIKALMKEVANL